MTRRVHTRTIKGVKKDSDADGPQLHKTRKVCLTGSKHMQKTGFQVAGEKLLQDWEVTPEERREFLHQYQAQTTARGAGSSAPAVRGELESRSAWKNRWRSICIREAIIPLLPF